jgi:hypothetical protein
MKPGIISFLARFLVIILGAKSPQMHRKATQKTTEKSVNLRNEVRKYFSCLSILLKLKVNKGTLFGFHKLDNDKN